MVKRKVASGSVPGRGSGDGRSRLTWKMGDGTRASGAGETSGFFMINMQVEGRLCKGGLG